jgi:hypothetical protein
VHKEEKLGSKQVLTWTSTRNMISDASHLCCRCPRFRSAAAALSSAKFDFTRRFLGRCQIFEDVFSQGAKNFAFYIAHAPWQQLGSTSARAFCVPKFGVGGQRRELWAGMLAFFCAMEMPAARALPAILLPPEHCPWAMEAVRKHVCPSVLRS